MIKDKLKENRLFIIFILFTIAYFVKMYIDRNCLVIRGDGYYMYTYFINSVLEGDIAKGGLIKYPVGTTLLQLPFLMVPYIWGVLHDISFAGNDSLQVYYFNTTVAVATLFYYLASMILLYRLMRKKYSAAAALVSCICLTYGTFLPTYVYYMASYSHVYGMFICVLFMVYVDYYENIKKRNIGHDILLGMILGIAILIRNTNVTIGLFYLLYRVDSVKCFLDRLKVLFSPKIIIQIISCALLFSVQLIIWRLQAGKWILYSYTGESFNHILDPQIGSVLFSDAKGLFIYSPVLVIGIISMVLYGRENKEYNLAQWSLFAVTTYIIAAWWCWWLGFCYGERLYCDMLPLFAVPFAAFYEKLFNTIKGYVAEGKFKCRGMVLACVICLISILFIWINMRFMRGIVNYELNGVLDYWYVIRKCLFGI